MIQPRVSVVIPVLNGADVITGCLDGIAAQPDAPPFEVVVVDNGSRDGTPEVARGHEVAPRVLVERAPGPYAARNAGMAAAGADVIALTDADCLPGPRWLSSGLAAIEEGAHLVGGRIAQLRAPHPTLWERYDRATYLDQERFVTSESFAATANLLVVADVVRQIGGFRPEFLVSGDLEFCRRATDRGFRLDYAPDAVVGHRPRATFHDFWTLHRKLGSGFAELASVGLRGGPWSDLGLRVPFEEVMLQVNADGPPLRRRQVAAAHSVAMAARWVGRLTRRW